MNIGDKVRFLNDVGGGKITGFRQGGIVLVEGEDGFAVPMPQHEVVVIEEKTASTPLPRQDKEDLTLNGKDYLQSKTVPPVEESEVDEQLEARVVRLEQTIQKLEARIALLEAENNLRKNERTMAHKAKPQPKPMPEMPKTIEDLHIL
ncbi:MAG: hypothetical protein J6T38_02685 [Bacteroidaceae bacterium]|nr:hypothetical protein [Bacteroidaceae bacterium]